MKAYYEAIVRKCKREDQSADVFLLNLEMENGDNFEALPGQFVVLAPKANRSVMPRPFSIVEIVGNVVTIMFRVVGDNTLAYSQLKEGDIIIVNGPQGKALEIDRKAVSYILLAGGIGGAALISLAKELMEQGINFTVLLGARDEMGLSGLEYFQKYTTNIFTITEINGGRTGFVTDLLADILALDAGISTVVACGRKEMLVKVSEICLEYKNPCKIMLEETMACGMGSCKGCAIQGIDGSIKQVCEDGPVFDAKWIDWNKLNLKTAIKIIDKPELVTNPMEVDLAGLILKYPTMNSSGCLSIEALEEGRFDYSRLGALVTKGVTLEARVGNIMPRTCETPAGMINSIGLQNVGIDRFLSEELPRWLKLGKAVFVNISGFKLDDYRDLVLKLEETDIAGYEVNISCPNLKERKIFGTDPDLSHSAVKTVKAITEKTVIAKLTPNVTDIKVIAEAVVQAGADAISLINTVQAMAIDPFSRKPKIGLKMGGLSGPAIRPIAVRMVREIYEMDLAVPIIGMGGIEDGYSAAEFILAGATIVAVGTGGFANREIFSQIDDELRELLVFHGFSSIKELTGNIVSN